MIPGPFAIRFHMHPSLRLFAARDGTAALIAGPDGSRWLLDAAGMPVAIEESIFFAGPDGPRRTEQVVVWGHTAKIQTVTWSLVRDA